jgi:hypothetical protein
VLVPIENVIEGSWASGAPPIEWTDHVLMVEMGWSWEELRRVPMMVRQVNYDILCMKAEYERQQMEKARKEQRG